MKDWEKRGYYIVDFLRINYLHDFSAREIAYNINIPDLTNNSRNIAYALKHLSYSKNIQRIKDRGVMRYYYEK